MSRLLSRHWRLAILLTVCVNLFVGCSPTAPQPVVRSGVALDTVVTVTLYEPADAALLDVAFDTIAHYEALLSRTREDSDVARINAASGTMASVDGDTAALLALCRQYGELTGGALDVTIAPVMDVWGFGTDHAAVPPDDRLTAARMQVDFRGLTVEGQTAGVSKGQALDLGAAAKGYIADRVAAVLRAQGVTAALLDLGGNIVAVGNKQGKSFRVGVRDPFNDTALADTVAVADQAVVTSGVYERGFEQQGVWYHHILDPATGYPADNGLASVTVVCEQAVVADMLSTACFVLGPQEGLALAASQPGVEALFITQDGERMATDGWDDLRI